MAEHVHATHIGELRLADMVDEVARDEVGTGARGALVAPLPAKRDAGVPQVGDLVRVDAAGLVRVRV